MRPVLLILLLALHAHAQQPQKAAQAANAHAWELFQLFRPMTEGNFCFSPFSSHQMAALLMTAADGESRKELAALAHLQGGTDQEIADLGAMRATLAATVRRGSLTMEMTTSLWAANAATFEPAFLSSSQTLFGASLQKLPAADATASAAAVNLWVREKNTGPYSPDRRPRFFSRPGKVRRLALEVNELGAEATAATAAPGDPFGDAPSIVPPKRRIVNFTANRPFIWALQHHTTGLILFMGRYAGT